MNQTLHNATHLAQPMRDIRDIKPLEALPTVHWLWVGLTGLGVMLVLILLWLWWRRRRSRLRPSPATPSLPAHEQAYKELDLLGTMNDLADRPYYFRLSHILRAYLASRFQIRAVTMTSEELIPALQHLGMAQETLQAIRHFCTTGDLIKYADTVQTGRKRQDDLNLVRQVVQTTREPDPSKDTQEPSR